MKFLFGGNPSGGHFFEIEDYVGWLWTGLPARVEHPGAAHAVDPCAVGVEGRVVDVTGKDEIRRVLGDPLGEKGVARFHSTGPTHGRAVGRSVVDPCPFCRASLGITVDEGLHFGAGFVTIPPRTDRDQGVPDLDAVAIHMKRAQADIMQPAADRFVGRSPRIAIVISGADEQARVAGDAAQVFFDDDNLGVQVE